MRPALPALTLGLALLAACAQTPPATPSALLDGVLPTPLLLVGEQHDAPAHQALQRELVTELAARGALAAVVMEMADAERSTQGLPRDAHEDWVRTALGWSDQSGWPWPVYGPVVMTAVRAGVPVLGGNLPRSHTRAVMGNAALDATVSPAVLQSQRERVREGHCDLLPPTQIGPMTRVQLARDRVLARTAVEQIQPGRTVLLIAGNGHVRSDIGIPRHLPPGQAHKVVVASAGPAGAGLPADAVWPTPALPERDHCAELRQQFGR